MLCLFSVEAEGYVAVRSFWNGLPVWLAAPFVKLQICRTVHLELALNCSRGEVSPRRSLPFLFVSFWDPLRSAEVKQKGEHRVHLFCLTRCWNFCFLSGLTSKVWRTMWKTRWTSPNLGADLLRTCTGAVICPPQLATAFPARADTPLYGKALNRAGGDLQTASARVRGVSMVFPIRIFFIFPRSTV